MRNVESAPIVEAGWTFSQNDEMPAPLLVDSLAGLESRPDMVHRLTQPKPVVNARVPTPPQPQDAAFGDAVPAQQDLQLEDPLAREALRLVGTAPGAEDYWIQAINNPNLPPSERSDLIEDLNEDGISDPPTPEDLPVIISRLSLIEDIADSAMDETNADAFQEAYKDLANMFDQLTAQ